MTVVHSGQPVFLYKLHSGLNPFHGVPVKPEDERTLDVNPLLVDFPDRLFVQAAQVDVFADGS